MHFPSLIEKKREGGELSPEEIAQAISGFTRGEVPDYQTSALAMAIFFRGTSDMGTWHLTKAMLDSGRVLVHFIVGFEHGKSATDRQWKFTRWSLVDLSHFQVKLKAEFQGSNRDMYRPEAIVTTNGKTIE